MAPGEIDWDKWSRHVESRRRRLGKRHPFDDGPLASRAYLAEATYVSFQLEGLDVTETEVSSALATGGERRVIRSRQGQRIRNHVAVLREIDAQVMASQPLTPEAYVRWYASISSGLCSADLGDTATARLVSIIHRINFPELRLPAAIQEICTLHHSLLTDPLAPSFNGILARLLLRYHLGRCDLPPVFFHPQTPALALTNPRLLLPMVMELLDNSFDVLLGKA
jgi:hypothetical protein